jgi:hypothetical protein
MNEKFREVCENLDWTIHEYEDGSVELEKYSPAGEDFTFGVSSDRFVEEVKEYAAYFDADEHVELWVDSRGKKGVPSSVRELVEDAEAIDKMLKELAAALAEVEDDEDV